MESMQKFLQIGFPVIRFMPDRRKVQLSGCQAAAYYIRHDLWHVNYGRGIIPPFHFARRYS